MKKKLRQSKRAVLAKVAMASALLCGSLATAQTVEFDRVIVFGDSLSDGGTYSNTAKAALGATAPDINYRFTTNNPDGSSRTALEVLAQSLGITLAPNVINPTAVGGTNYAQGGARVTNPAGSNRNIAAGITTVPVVEQVNRLLTASPTLTDKDLVVLWAGGNDVLAQVTAIGGGTQTVSGGLAAVGQAAGELVAQVQRLQAAGAKYVLVATVPELALTPRGVAGGTATQALLTTLVGTFNQTLTASVPQNGVVVIDVNKLLVDVIANPTTYGFNANAAGVACPTLPAPAGGSALFCVNTNPSNFIFADDIHPSARAHALFGAFAVSGLRAIAQGGALVVGPMTGIRQHSQGLESRLHIGALVNDQGAVRKVGDSQAFARLEGGLFKTKAEQIQPSVRAVTEELGAGVDTMVARNALIGAAVAYGHGSSTFGNNSGSLSSNNAVGVVYTTVALSRNLYINGSAAYGRIDHSLTRQINFDSLSFYAVSSPNGDYRSFRLGGGYVTDLGSWKGGPYMSYTDEKTTVSGFDEGGGAVSLSFGDIDYRAKRLTLGFLAGSPEPLIGGWRPFVRGSYDRDLDSKDLVIPIGSSSSALGLVSVPRPDQDTWSINLGAGLPTAGGGEWKLALGAGGNTEQVIATTLGLSYRLTF